MNKDTALRMLGEAGSLQFRFEVFNLLNHPSFTAPGAAQTGGSAPATVATQFGISPTAGLISSTTTTARQIQLALKLIF